MHAVAIIVCAVILIHVTAILGRLCGLVDHPDDRKQHLGVIPLTGGIAIMATLVLGTYWLSIPPLSPGALGLALGLALLGLVDDYAGVHPGLRLGLQYLAGILLATWGGIVITNVGNLLALGDIPLLMLAIPLTALSVAGLSNAYNMIDGINGLAGSLIALPLLVLYALAVQKGHPGAMGLLLMLLPVLVFLCFNLGPDNALLPRVFLGDNGSITLGYLVTAALVFYSQGDQALIRPVTALWLVTVPLMDMLATMLRRIRHRRPLMDADNLHLHHTLISLGCSRATTLVILLAYALCAALIGLLLESLPAYISMACYFLLFFFHCLFVVSASRLGERFEALRCSNA